jgi:heme exporter protein C
MSFWEFANPARFMRLSGRILPWLVALAVLSLGGGLIWGFFLTPDADQFGSTVKIIYIHVPSAFLAINIYFMMFVTSLIWLIRRHHVSALAAKAAAPIGAAMTLVALITGALWGQPMWGTWWVWDPRLTSFLIMFVFYLGYLALWAAIEEPDKAADLTSILALVGSLFAVLSRYAVNFWNQGLHQGASLSMDAEENVSDVFWQPLVLSIIGFFALFLVLLLIGTRTEIRSRRLRAMLMQEAN